LKNFLVFKEVVSAGFMVLFNEIKYHDIYQQTNNSFLKKYVENEIKAEKFEKKNIFI
jgi:hypothetical protein